MDRRALPPLRSLPRAFVPAVEAPAPRSIQVPTLELHKFRKVLRLVDGDEIALLPGDGRLLLCELNESTANVTGTYFPDTESKVKITLALALSRQDKIEESVRMASELGVSGFYLFPSDRTIVRWDRAKLTSKLARFQVIAREACEVAFRTKLPTFELGDDLADCLRVWPTAQVLSESDRLTTNLAPARAATTLVIGPEGGWSPREVEWIGDRAMTLGPRVLRVDTAAAAACAIALSQ